MTASNVTYLRWRNGESRRGPTFNPPDPDHPLFVNQVPCLICNDLLAGHRTQLLVIGPDDVEDQAKHDSGRWYAALAVVAHERCLSQLSDTDVEDLVSGLVEQAEASAEASR